MRPIDTYAEYVDLRPNLVVPTIRSATLEREVAVPCMNTLLVRPSLVVANQYNPNAVPPDKMSLLRESIVANGFCFPVVTIADDEREAFVVIDGFHRTVISSPAWLAFDYQPIVVLPHGMAERMVATVQFNKARGHHQVDLDADLVCKLVEQGLTEDEIADRLKLDVDDVHRYRQVAGDVGLVAGLFRNTPYSMAWEMREDES